MKNLKLLFSIILFAVIFIASCKKDKDVTPTSPGDGSNGAIINANVSSTTPANNATGVARNLPVTVSFTGAMDATTINASTFLIKQGTTPVAGEVSYSGTTATFTPTNTFAPGTVYSATLTTGIKDATGKALETITRWKFTTAGTAPTTGETGSTIASVNLRTAGNYVILAKTAINNSSISAITGNLGISPAATSYITGLSLTNATGYATSSQVTGKVFAADMVVPTSTNLTTAINDMNTAYNDAAGRPSPDFSALGAGNIGGKKLTSGLYKWSNTVTIPSSVTISGNANDVWIFQIAGDLTVASGVKILLSGGAQAKNIFWQVAGEVTIGTTAQFQGIVLSKTGITLKTDATMNGRALAQTAVILDKNVISNP